MKSHDLAYRLLNSPNQDVLVHTVNGMETIDSFIVEDANHRWHHYNETNSEKYDFKNGEQHKVVEEKNDQPCIILISESTGIC